MAAARGGGAVRRQRRRPGPVAVQLRRLLWEVLALLVIVGAIAGLGYFGWWQPRQEGLTGASTADYNFTALVVKAQAGSVCCNGAPGASP